MEKGESLSMASSSGSLLKPQKGSKLFPHWYSSAACLQIIRRGTKYLLMDLLLTGSPFSFLLLAQEMNLSKVFLFSSAKVMSPKNGIT